MFISVIIPTYNRARYLPKSLLSLVGQNFSKEEFEVIVVDDGGNENVEPIINQFKDKLDINYFKEKHLGVCHARNTGINKARGEVLAFFDDDAVADGDWLKNVSQIMANENIVVGRGKPISDSIWQYFAPHYDRGDGSIELKTIWECNLAVKKSVFNDVGQFDEKIDWGHEGNEFAGRCQGKYKIIYCPEMVIFHDYAFGLINYFKKQKKFGEKLVYLKTRPRPAYRSGRPDRGSEIKSLYELIFNYSNVKGTGEISSNDKLNKLPILKKMMIKIIAKIGSWFHFYGSVIGYFKYKSQ